MNSSERRKEKLGDICINITDGKHGDCKNEANSGFYFVSVKDIYDGKINYENARQITEDDFQETHKRTRLGKDDILVTNSGTIGRMALVKDDDRTDKTTFQKSVAIIKPDKNIINPLYLYYFIKSDIKRLSEFAGGTTQKNLLLKDLRNFKIIIPSFIEQKSIANTLSCLDEKIEINNRINNNLEEIARAIFKSWFFDFEPFQDGKFEDSELGKIPKGWKVGVLDDVLLSIEAGNRPKGGVGNLDSGIPSIGAENVIGLGKYDFSKEKFVSEAYFENMNKGVVQNWDVLLYKDGAQLGRKTMFAQDFPHKKCCINSHVFILRCNSLISQIYLYFWLDQEYMTQSIINLNTNSAQPGINQPAVKQLKILIPDVNTIRQFNHLTERLMIKLFEVCKESQTLELVRDALLQKLMSGEIRVPIEEVQ